MAARRSTYAKKVMIFSFIQVITRLILGGVFFWAGIVKIPETALFAYTIRAYNLLPESLILPVAILAPWLECVIGLCLILGFWTHANALIASCLLILFSGALGIKIYQGASISCGCFGTEGGSLEWALLQDVLLFSLALALLLKQKILLSLDGYLRVRSHRDKDARADSIDS